MTANPQELGVFHAHTFGCLFQVSTELLEEERTVRTDPSLFSFPGNNVYRLIVTTSHMCLIKFYCVLFGKLAELSCWRSAEIS